MSGTMVVCGAGGFIGGHLVDALLELGERVRAVDIKPSGRWHQFHDGADNLQADLRRPEACRLVCTGAERVYNLAADMGGIGFIERRRADCMRSVTINTHLLEACRMARVERYFYASSACVYHARNQDRLNVSALAERHAYYEGGVAPERGYGEEKWFSERLCQEVAADYGLATRIARFHNVYGPEGEWRGGREKAPAAICRKVIEAKHTGSGEIEIWGDGLQTRSFCWIDDCIHALVELTDSDEIAPVNIGSAELVTINQLVDLAEGFAGVTLKRKYNPDAPKGVRGRNSDNTRFRALFGWEPDTPLAVGLRQTYDWIEREWLSHRTSP